MVVRLKMRTLLFLAAAAAAVGVLQPAKADPDEMLPVPAATIYPGDAIVDSMLVDRAFPAGTSTVFPIVVTHAELKDKVARRTLLPGRPIAVNAVMVRAVVQRGTVIPATYHDAGLVITASVLALEDGVLNAAIQARNVDTGKVIVGLVQADGSIQIGLQ